MYAKVPGGLQILPGRFLSIVNTSGPVEVRQGDKCVSNMAATSCATCPTEPPSLCAEVMARCCDTSSSAAALTSPPLTRKSMGMGGDTYRISIFLDNSRAKLARSARDCNTAPIFCQASRCCPKTMYSTNPKSASMRVQRNAKKVPHCKNI